MRLAEEFSPKVLLISVAGPLHERRVLAEAERAQAALKLSKADVESRIFPRTNELSALKREFGRFDEVVVFAASGGTSRAVTELVAGERAWIWAYSRNNSLPSALSAIEKMRRRGVWRGYLVYGEPHQCPKKLVNRLVARAAAKRIRGLRALVVGDDGTWEKLREDARDVERLFGVAITFKSIEALQSRMSSIDLLDVEEFLRSRGNFVLGSLKPDWVRDATKMYLAVRSWLAEEGFDAFTIDCFPVIEKLGVTPCLTLALLCGEGVVAACEADLWALSAMAIGYALCGEVPWMANLAQIDADAGEVVLAHCTAPTSLAQKPIELTTHFESGKSVSLRVSLPKGDAVLLHTSPIKPVIRAHRVRVIDSPLGLESLCRTQARLEVDRSLLDKVELLGNHQVLVYGDFLDALRELRLCVEEDQ